MPLLPRFNAAMQKVEDQRKIGRILEETGEVITATVQKATLAGDTRRLRGIPAIGRGVAGVSPGTNPTDVIRRRLHNAFSGEV
jgi:hypothetical protein